MKPFVVASTLEHYVWPLSTQSVKAYELVIVREGAVSIEELADTLQCKVFELDYFSKDFVFRHFKKGVLNPKSQSLAQALGSDAHHFTVLTAVQCDQQIKAPERELLLRAWCEPAIESFAEGSLYDLITKLWAPPSDRVDDSCELSSDPAKWGLELSADELAACLKVRQQFTRAEWECLAQSWSEHCKHKIFSASIELPGFGDLKVSSLFKDFIKGPSLKIIEQDPSHRALSVFEDNAGVVRVFDRDGQPTSMALALKMETHNSPSAISPRGGAATGLVGVHRDILGTGLGARPIANWNVLCFESSVHNERRSEGALAPAIVRKGVICGIEEGGNQSGIPTVQGSVFFAPEFVAKPYVFAGSIGLLKDSDVQKRAAAGQTLFCVGNHTGRDGLRGAVMSSRDLRSSDLEGSSVQVASPYIQRRMTDFLLSAQSKGLIDCITDNGAGGLSSSVGEMASHTSGARIDLSALRLKDSSIVAWEKLLSESQERMTVATAKPREFTELALHFGVGIDAIGTLTKSGLFEVFDADRCLVQLPLSLLHDGCPKMRLKSSDSFDAESKRIHQRWLAFPDRPVNVWHDAKTLLLSEDCCSREGLARHFDHEVQGRSLTKIYAGERQKSPYDFSLIEVQEIGTSVAVALSHGGSPHPRSPVRQALMAFDEALRSIVLSGADLKTIVALDNFSWPDPLANDRHLAHLVRVCQTLARACDEFKIPLVSGKDSMKNTSQGIDCLPILVVSMGASAIRAENTPVSAASRANEVLFALDPLDASFEDSAWSRVVGGRSGSVSALSSAKNIEAQLQIRDELLQRLHRRYLALSGLVRAGQVRAAKDISEGGLALALFKLLRGSGLGAHLEHDLGDLALGEGLGGYLMSVDPHLVKVVESALLPHGLRRLGVTTKHFEIRSPSGQVRLGDLDQAHDQKNLEGFWQ
jgi:phosphoribosylformylglycinamidine (FGAM) synthase-like enzyme